MKKICSIFFLLMSFSVAAQNFAPIGAVWHYEKCGFADFVAYETIESYADTVINGISCRQLKETDYNYQVTNTYYMYSRNDSVFFHKNGGFHLLYDFGAEAGDTVVLGYYQTYHGTPLKMFIDSTTMINVNGQMRKLQYIRCGDSMSIEFGSLVIEGIGSTSYMFPTGDLSYDGPWRCYTDALIPEYHNPYYNGFFWHALDCEEIIVGIPDLEAGRLLRLSPNPANRGETVRVELPGKSSLVELIDPLGRMCFSTNVQDGESVLLPTEGLVSGLYIILIVPEIGKPMASKLVVH